MKREHKKIDKHKEIFWLKGSVVYKISHGETDRYTSTTEHIYFIKDIQIEPVWVNVTGTQY